jgi:hypothetical protein
MLSLLGFGAAALATLFAMLTVKDARAFHGEASTSPEKAEDVHGAPNARLIEDQPTPSET